VSPCGCLRINSCTNGWSKSVPSVRLARAVVRVRASPAARNRAALAVGWVGLSLSETPWCCKLRNSRPIGWSNPVPAISLAKAMACMLAAMLAGERAAANTEAGDGWGSGMGSLLSALVSASSFMVLRMVHVVGK
jgi:hypothetical protein